MGQVGTAVARPLYGPSGDVLPAAMRAAARAHGQQSARAFRGASWSDPDLINWNPPLYSPHSALGPDRDKLAGRIHDLARNDGWASAGVQKVVDSIVGSGWMLFSTPNAKALGISDEAADEFAAQVESAWEEYAEDPDCWIDVGRRLTFGGILGLAFKHRLWDGEALGGIMWKPDGRPRANGYNTCVQVIHPDRLSNPYSAVDRVDLRAGIALDPSTHAPLGYWIRSLHPGDTAIVYDPKFWQWDYWQRETEFGRRLVFHAFEPDGAGAVRGVSIFAPLVKKLKNLSRYDETELQAAIINAVLAAFIETPFDQEQLVQAMQGQDELSAYQNFRVGFHEQSSLDMGGAKIGFLAPGEKATLSKPGHPNSVFEHYMRAGLRNIASVIGTTYEQLSTDWSQSNYSSARGAIIEAWRGFNARKDVFAVQTATPIFAAWLEEAIDIGRVKMPAGRNVPSFWERKAAWTSCEWIGPGRGWVDPLKEAEAAIVRIAGGLSTLRRECAEQGLDYRKVIAQIARERRQLKDAGLDPDQAASLAGKVKGNIGTGKKDGADDGSGGAKDGSTGGSQ